MSTSEIEEARREFYTIREMLKADPTKPPIQESELNEIMRKLSVTRAHLIEIDPEFRDFIEKRQKWVSSETREARDRKNMLTVEAKGIATTSRTRAKEARRTAEESLGKWVQAHRVRKISPEEIDTQTEEPLFCPICHDPNRGNMMNGEPTCLKCWHKLVPKSEFKNYNRAYRRRWKKNRR